MVLEVIIQPNGRATDLNIVKSAGSALDQKALAAVKNWRFKPALGPNGKSVPTITAIEVIFRGSSGRPTQGFGTGA
jgi:TonB family protein